MVISTPRCPRQLQTRRIAITTKRCLSLRLGLLLLTGLVVISGCGGSTRVPVAGRVQFSDDEPVRTGKIEFRGRDERVRAAGVLDEEGRFRLRGDEGEDGLPPGEYDIAIVQVVLVEYRSLEEHGHGRPLSRKYADYYTSGLSATVPPGGINDLAITVEP